MFADFPGQGIWNFDPFIYSATYSLLAVADVARAHYLCSILHQLSSDPLGSPVSGSIGDAPLSGNLSLSCCGIDSFLSLLVCNNVLSQYLLNDDNIRSI